VERGEIPIGEKPVDKYLLSVLILKDKYSEIAIKARGKHIPKAIRVADAAVKKAGFTIFSTQIGIETDERNPERRTPYIEIILRCRE